MNLFSENTLENRIYEIFEANKTGQNDVLIICGPTASGKSSAAFNIAKAVDGEIISCDSMQIYKRMDIGTAKATKEEREIVPHHMLDIIEPWESYDCYQYKAAAEIEIKAVLGRGKLPIVCGGTGLYVSSLVENREYAKDIDPEKYSYLDEWTIAEIYKKLQEIDPQAAEEIHINNEKRVKRALILSLETGETREQRNILSRRNKPEFNYICVCLNPDREALYKKINRRVDEMFDEGLIPEAKAIYSEILKHKTPEDAAKLTSLAAIGYKELIPNFSEGAKDLIKQNTRHYAKRQLTWFKKIENIVFIDF